MNDKKQIKNFNLLYNFTCVSKTITLESGSNVKKV